MGVFIIIILVYWSDCRFMGVFIIIILVYWSECNLPAAVDGMVTDRFYGRSDGTNLRRFFDSRIVADSQ